MNFLPSERRARRTFTSIKNREHFNLICHAYIKNEELAVSSYKEKERICFSRQHTRQTGNTPFVGGTLSGNYGRAEEAGNPPSPPRGEDGRLGGYEP